MNSDLTITRIDHDAPGSKAAREAEIAIAARFSQ